MKFEDIVLVVGGTLTGLFAGLLYAFSVAVVPALRRLTGREHLAAIQAINVKILNPVFFLSFLGPTLLLPLAAFLHRSGSQFGLLVAAAVLHIVGANGVTIMGNVPLNDQLAKRDVSHLSEAEADHIRKAFQGTGTPWMRWHTVRTLAATAATVLVFLACLSKSMSR
jgi:uncharacterized membrane protein